MKEEKEKSAIATNRNNEETAKTAFALMKAELLDQFKYTQGMSKNYPIPMAVHTIGDAALLKCLFPTSGLLAHTLFLP